MKRLLWLTLAVAVVSVGCGSKDEAEEALPTGEVAVKVNDKAISVEDVKKVAGNFRRQGLQPDAMAQGDSFEERLYYTAVDRLIDQALVLQDAAKHGLSVGPDELQASIDQLQVMAGGPEGFQTVLTQNNITMEDVRKDMEINLLMQQYFQQVVTPSMVIPDEEIEAFYNENADQFAAKPEVRARHILFRIPPSTPEMALAEIRQRAQAVLIKARAGEDFATLAQENSEDETTSMTGGDLSWFGQGRMVAAFDSAAFALNSGEVSGLVQTQFGYHIIKVEETRTTGAQTLEAARETIRGTLTQGKSQDEYTRVVAELREQGTIEIEPPSAETLAAITL